jgi:hypothetical protein
MIVIWRTHKIAEFFEWSMSMVKASSDGRFGTSGR